MNVTIRISAEPNDDGSKGNESALFGVAIGTVRVVVNNVLNNRL